MNRINIIIIVLIFALFTFSCSTELDINDEWSDIPVIFCILDQSQEYQYIKVNKTFLGEKPASEMAQHSDSLYYENVKVILYEYDGNNTISAIEFTEVDTIPKESGYFANDKNIIYITDYQLNENYKYQLEVTIDDGRKVISSDIIELISGAAITRPHPQILTISVHRYDAPFTYAYNPGYNTKVSQMNLYFNYIEVLNEDTAYHTIKWPQSLNVRSDDSDNNTIEGSFEIKGFYSQLANNIPEADENLKRYAKMPDSFEFRLSIANRDYSTYMEISAPSHGIIQEKPSFSNIDDAIGLFAAKYNTNKIIKLDGNTLDSISRGIYTKHLGFQSRHSEYYQ